MLGDGLRAAFACLGASPMLLGNTTLVGADEVAGVAVPTRRGRPSLAVAILAGTVVHFVAFDAGLIALVRPLLIDAAPRTIHLLGAAMVPALCLILIRERGRLDRPAGPALLAL